MAKCRRSDADGIMINERSLMAIGVRRFRQNAGVTGIPSAVVDRIGVLAYVPPNAVVQYTRPIHPPPGGQGSARNMFLFQFLLVVHFCVAAALVSVILVQKSEGGGLGMGGSPSGLMSARGAADFLTRATSTLGAVFIALSILLAVLAAQNRVAKVDPTLATGAATAPAPIAPPVQTDPNNPFASGARSAIEPTGNTVAPANGAATTAP